MIKSNLIIGLELLRTHSIACLNRGEHGEVKTSFFGGLQRLRISSQCSKRAVREAMHDALGDGRGYRTIQLGQLLATRLDYSLREQSDFLSKLIVHALSGQKLEKENANTLLFISDPELDAIAQLFADAATRDALFGLYTAKVSSQRRLKRPRKPRRKPTKRPKRRPRLVKRFLWLSPRLLSPLSMIARLTRSKARSRRLSNRLRSAGISPCTVG